eukprot:12059908-Heterocapsa_arctica.AAC.1
MLQLWSLDARVSSWLLELCSCCAPWSALSCGVRASGVAWRATLLHDAGGAGDRSRPRGGS